MLMNTQWRCVSAIVAVDIQSGAVVPVTPVGPAAGPTAMDESRTGGPASYSLACVAGGRAFAIRSSLHSPPHVVAAALPPDPSSLFAAPAASAPLPSSPSAAATAAAAALDSRLSTSAQLLWEPVAGFDAGLPPTIGAHLADLVCIVQQVTPRVGDASQVWCDPPLDMFMHATPFVGRSRPNNSVGVVQKLSYYYYYYYYHGNWCIWAHVQGMD
jgi:hypothetical protein